MPFITEKAVANHADTQQKHRPESSGSGSTISTSIYHSVTVGTGGYLSPLSITTAGVINPSQQAYGAVGLVLAAAGAVATITNSGQIDGGYGAYGSTSGGAGGLAVELASAFIFNNKGVIAGGNGGASAQTGGAGGVGVAISATGTFTNSGQIDGGEGGYRPGIGGAVGVGIDASATLINAGVIRGGYGGGVGGNGTYGATGGYGVSATDEDLVKNTGIIIGGAGGNASVFGGEGGIGALFEYGTLMNGGTILGGAGGAAGSVENDQGFSGGVGVYLLNASTAANTGLIRGGNGNYGFSRGGYGGDGVFLQTYGSLANSGTITGGAGGIAHQIGGNGGNGLDVTAYSTASNAGVISGGNGGAANSYYGRGGDGGSGVVISQSSFSNTGKIMGGSGGSTPGFKTGGSYNIPGGSGLEAFDGVVTNAGMITGGAGGSGFANGGTAGSGGLGVYLNGSTLTNTGTITGGTGGHVPQSDYNNAYGGIGGAGALVLAGSTLVNNKLIKGGAGGYDIYVGATGGDGVIIDGGVFTNAGTVTQGYGGTSQRSGLNGDAVFFAGAGTLMAAPGAKFVGSVVSSLSSGSVLELTGSASTPLSGIGSQFIGINLVSFAAGATRALEGKLGGIPESGNYGAVIAGFAAHDTLVLDGFAANPADTYIQTRFGRIDFYGPGNKFDTVIYTNLLAKDLEVTTGGGKTTLTGLGTTATTLAAGAAEFIRAGGTATGTIDKGATEDVMTGGTVTATTIAGGELTLAIGAKTAGTLSFSGTGGLLDILSHTMPTGTIASFVSGDTIELDGIAYNANDKVTVGTAGTVTIVAPGIAYDLDIAGATKGETDFKFSAGSVLTRTAAARPAMRFIAPAAVTPTPAPCWLAAPPVAVAIPAAHQLAAIGSANVVTLSQAGAASTDGAGWGGPHISIATGSLDPTPPVHALPSF